VDGADALSVAAIVAGAALAVGALVLASRLRNPGSATALRVVAGIALLPLALVVVVFAALAVIALIFVLIWLTGNAVNG